MRKILGRKDNSKRNQLILGIGLVLLMLVSTAGYAINGRDNKNTIEKIEYNNVEFVRDSSEYWKFNVQGNNFVTLFNPEELQDIDFNGNLVLSDLQNKPLYFVGGSNEPIAEIARNMERFVLRIQNACINKEDCEGDLPLKNCSEDNVVVISEKLEQGEEKIYSQGNCIFIEANFANQTKYADKLIYDLLNI